MLKLAKSVVQRIGGESSNGVALNGKVAKEDAPSLSVPAFLIVTLQLGLVLFAMHLFQIETATGFNRLFPIIFGGFIVHAWLPKALRMPFFVALSGAGIAIVSTSKGVMTGRNATSQKVGGELLCEVW